VDTKIVPVILVGGSGKRLWPVSNQALPKQFAKLFSDGTLLEKTLSRIKPLIKNSFLVLIGNQGHQKFLFAAVKKAKIKNAFFIFEPVGKNTAPAAALAAWFLKDKNPEALFLLLPSDHLILNSKNFFQAIKKAAVLANKGNLVCFGSVPNRPETGYGYIKAGPNYRIDNFIEKPSLKLAEKYLAEGNYFWNSGMFLFGVQSFLAELKEHAPKIFQATKKIFTQANKKGKKIFFDRKIFSQCPSDSIDYSLMEKTTKGAVVPLDAGWSDVGSWETLWEVIAKNPDGNVLVGDVFSVETKNSYLRAEEKKVVTIGLDDFILVETKDTILVMPKNKSQVLKEIVDKL
jgi:mannose-1-phosphate guanylyltransferase/mannose-6-phosphate isomerase